MSGMQTDVRTKQGVTPARGVDVAANNLPASPVGCIAKRGENNSVAATNFSTCPPNRRVLRAELE